MIFLDNDFFGWWFEIGNGEENMETTAIYCRDLFPQVGQTQKVVSLVRESDPQNGRTKFRLRIYLVKL